jgi:hypothetical protein
MVISCWNKDNADPSGYRHFESGIYKPAAKIGNVGGFPAQLESGVALDFGEAIVDSSGFYTETAIITLNLGEVNKNPASYFNLCLGSIGTRFKAFNIKLWLASSGAFAGYSPTFYFLPSKTWDKGRRITSSTPGVQVVPLSAPVSQNIFSKNNNIYISGCYKDLEFTHYVYIVGKFPPGSYSLGEYGGLGSGNFTFKASYDYTDIDANTIGVDVID